MFCKMPRNPIEFFSNSCLGINKFRCRNRFKRIVSAAMGVLGHMCSCNRLTCRARDAKQALLFFSFASWAAA